MLLVPTKPKPITRRISFSQDKNEPSNRVLISWPIGSGIYEKKQ